MGLLIVGSLVFDAYLVMLVSELKNEVEEFYQRDFVEFKLVSEQLVSDIEKDYGTKLPPIELNIRLLEYSETGIQYKNDNKTLQIFLPSNFITFGNRQKRAYLAHELGHYVLGHLDNQKPETYPFVGTGDLARDIETDIFVLRFSTVEELSWLIKKIVWNEDEKRVRLSVMDVN